MTTYEVLPFLWQLNRAKNSRPQPLPQQPQQTSKQASKQIINNKQTKKQTKPNKIKENKINETNTTKSNKTKQNKKNKNEITPNKTTNQPTNQPTKQTNKQTNNQPTTKQTNKQTNKQTTKQTNKQKNKQTNQQTNNQPNKQTNKQPNKQTNKQPTNQPNTQTNKRQRDMQKFILGTLMPWHNKNLESSFKALSGLFSPILSRQGQNPTMMASMGPKGHMQWESVGHGHSYGHFKESFAPANFMRVLIIVQMHPMFIDFPGKKLKLCQINAATVSLKYTCFHHFSYRIATMLSISFGQIISAFKGLHQEASLKHPTLPKVKYWATDRTTPVMTKILSNSELNLEKGELNFWKNPESKWVRGKESQKPFGWTQIDFAWLG